MALLIKADGTRKEVKPSGKHFTLKELQSLVGGYIQIVSSPHGGLLVLNEEGKLNGLEFNELATSLFYPESDYIVGDVLHFRPTIDDGQLEEEEWD